MNPRIALLAATVLFAIHGTPSLAMGMVKLVVLVGLVTLCVADRLHPVGGTR
jgi:hypothetical protein